MKKAWLLALFLGFHFFAYSQAVESSCSDGVDNDLDGFIDCFDGDCANVAACNDSYIGKDKLCQTTPPAASKFQMTLKKKSPNVTTTHGRFAVGDMGGPGGKDGVPEVVTVHAGEKKFYILNGLDMTIKHSANTVGTPERYDIAIGNVNNDNCAEAFFVETDNGKFYIASYDCQANLVWRVETLSRPFTLGIADLDHDGKVELYYKNEILDAVTGQRLVKGTGNWLDIDSGPVAVDMLADAACTDCAGLEIVLGGEIYSVKLPTTRTAADTDAGSMTVVKRFNDIPTLGTLRYFPKAINLGGASFANSQTSVADYNLDGNLDVLMTGASSTSNSDPVTIFYWDVSGNNFKTYQPKQTDNTGWVYGAGRLNVADLDGDGKMNVAFVSGSRLFALNENLEILKIKKKGTNIDSADWIKTISEVSSGFTSTTVFDFNNDNASEIVYRDENNVYIFNGKTGVASPPVACKSLTTNDYPIVTDVDADGSTEICVVCEDGSDSNDGSIKSYKSALQPWVSARRVWNQHGYFNVNVNDDLTIPRFQQKHHLSFSTNICTPGQPNRALNSFLNQSAILDSKGCKTYPTADILFEPSPLLINVEQPTCPDQNFKVSFSLKNSGDISLSGAIPVTFYSGDPRLAGATKLNTHTVNVTNFKPGDIVSATNVTVNGTGLTFTLYAVLNDAGTTVPTPIVLPNSGFLECNYTNNVATAGIKSKDFDLSTLTTAHVQCSATGTPANGSAKAFKLVGATQQTVGFSFYWFNGATAGPTGSAAFVGPNRSPLLNGTYSVYALHNTFGCGSDTVQAVVPLQTKTISATVQVRDDFTNCNNPDGELRAVPSVGSHTLYTYKWFQGTVFGTSPILSTDRDLDNARGLTYSVLVTEIATGCETIATGTVPDLTNKPVVEATATAAVCSPVNSADATANVPGQNNNNFAFRWYNGTTVKASADDNTRVYDDIPPGFYTVTAKRNSTGCISDPFIIEIPAPPVFAVTGVVTSHETSCKAPNGAVSANINGSTAGYTFEWFTGNNTTLANRIATTPTKTLLTAGQYTVKATHTATGCTDTDLVTIDLNKQIPTVNASTLSDQTNCTPPNGSVTASAANAPGPFQFLWFNGTVGTPDTTASNFKGATYSSRTAGTYTVVAIDKVSRCASVKAVVPVANNTVIPVVSHTVVDQTSCNPAAPNGSASANVGGATAGFKFRWFTGSDTTTFITQAASITSRAAGTYTVKAQNLTTRCFATKLVTIAQLADKPVLSLTKVDNSICSPGVGFNGSVTSTITSNPNFQAGQPLVYEWKRNNVVIVGATGATLNNADAANYSVIVTNTALGCSSDSKNITVGDITVAPAITTTFIGSTNCAAGTSNGSVTVTVPATGAQYRWYAGNTAGVGAVLNASVTNPTASGLQGGAGQNYTVEVTIIATGCKSTATILLPDNSEVPVLGPLSKTDNLKCEDPRNGTASVGTVTYKGAAVNAPYTGYTFAWSNTGTTPTISNLPAGNYTLTVTKTDVGCTSAVKSVTVDNAPVLPAIVTAVQKSTNCAGGAANGEVSVTNTAALSATAAPGIAEYRWYAGSSVGAPGTEVNVGNNSFATGLQGGPTTNFTVEVEFSSTGCKSTATVLLTDDSKVPLLGPLTSDPNTKCENPRNGEAHLGTVNYRGNPVTFPNAAFEILWSNSETDVVDIDELPVASYSVTVRHKAHNCTSAAESVNVMDASVLPTIAAIARKSKNCVGGTADGEVEVTNTAALTAAAPGGLVEYRWYLGSSVGAAGTEVNALNNPLVTGLQGGPTTNYTVEVEFTNTGCKKDFSLALGEDKQLPLLGALTMDPNTKCEDPRDGEAHLGTVNYRGSLIAMPDPAFAILWSNGGTTKDIDDLAVGNYSVQVRHIAHNCISDPEDGNVLNAAVIPSIAALGTPSTNCPGGDVNGSVSVTNTAALTTAAPGGVVEYRWFAGASPVGAKINTGNNSFVNDLQGSPTASFTVEVEFSNSGCASNFTVMLTDDSKIPVIGPLAETDNINCTAPFNGTASIPVGTITYRGSVIASPYTGFTLAWSTSSASETISALAAGVYTLKITHDADNCESDLQTVTVGQDLDFPVIAITTLNDQTSCDDSDPLGQLQATETSALGTYTFDWYAGVGVGAVGTELSETVDGTTTPVLGVGDYTVRVMETSTRCASTKTEPIVKNTTFPVLALSQASDVENCANPDGQVVATPSGLTSTLDGDFTIYFIKQNTSNAAVVKTGFSSTLNASLTRSNLGPGYFASLIRDEITHCESQVDIVQVMDNTNPANISITGITTATFCNSGNDGGINIQVNGGVGPFTFNWHVGGPTNAGPYDYLNDENGTLLPTFNPDAPPFPVTTEDLTLVAAGFYSVEVIDSRGCGTVFSETVPFQDAPQVAVTKLNSTQCDPLNGDGAVTAYVLGFSNYSINVYRGLNLATAVVTANSVQFGNDGVDNDGDTFIDAADPDFDAGGATLCTDGIDNDGDTFIDSDDADCDGGGSAICTDGMDNDGDGLIDAADPDCDGVFTDLNFNVPGLNPGSYLVEVVDNAINCKIYKTAIISIDAKTPVVTLGTVSANTACLPGSADGSVEITVTKDPTDLTMVAPSYQITSITAPIATPATGIGMPIAIAANTLTELFTNPPFAFNGGFSAQTYQIAIEETNSGCVTNQFVTIPSQPATPQIGVAITNERLCAPLSEGAAVVNMVSMHAVTNYQFSWDSDPAALGTTPDYQANGTGTPAGGERYANGKTGFNMAGPGLAPGNRKYYVRGQLHANAGAGAGCLTNIVETIIPDVHISPVVDLTPFANTSCAPGSPEGEIEVDVTDASTVPPTPGPGFVYNYVWTGPTAIAAGPFNGTNNSFTLLQHGAYQLTATNANTGCATVETTNIVQNTTPIFVATVNSTAQLLCSPDGSLTVSQIDFKDRTGATQSVIGAGLGNFTYQWFRNGTVAPANVVGGSTNVLNNGNYGAVGTIGFDNDYYVVATRTTGAPGRNCSSAPFRAEILDQRVFPNVTLTPFNNTSCAAGQPEGEIEVDVTDASVMPPGPAFAYTYAFTGPTTITSPGTFNGTNNLFSNLLHGTYQLTVTNTTTSCPKVESITVLQNLTPIFVAVVNSTPQLLCSPDGSLTVQQITFNDRNGVPQNVNTPAGLADFSFQWFRNGSAAGNVVGAGGTLLNNVSYPAIGFDDDYYVVATRTAGAPGRNCASAPFRVSIADQRVFPIATLEPFSNTSCAPGLPEGEIEVDVTDASVVAPVPGPAFQYSYAWTTNGTPIATANFNGTNNLFSSLLHGNYQLTVTNTTTQCQTVENTVIQQNTTPIFVATVNSLPQLLCNPDGSLTVTQITFNDRDGIPQNVNTPAGLGNFSYQWFRNGTAGANVVGGATNVLNSASYASIGFDDDYFVVATRIAGAPGRNCSSAPFRVAIDDQRVFPVVTLTPQDNTSCDATIFEGDIEVDVTDGSVVAPVPGPMFTYTYGWAALTAGRTAPATPANPYNGLNNMFTNVQDGTYQLTATNTTTGCVATEQTVVTKNTTPVFVTNVTATPQLLCAPDGSLQLTQIRFIDRAGANQNVSGAGLADFEFTWFRDGTAAGNQVGTLSTLLNNVNYPAIGADPDYFITARRIANGPGLNCQSAPFRVEIDDLRVLPVVNLTSDPNTVCDTNYDGAMSVLVTDASTVPGPFNFNYTWTALTAGRAIPVTTNPYNGNNNPFPGIQDGRYQLVVQNNQSLCTALTAEVDVLQILPPVEIINVVKVDQRDCAPFDGSITVDASNASHVSVTGTYSFTWTRNGAPVATPTPSNILAQINAGDYTVTGTKSGGTGSGCVTSPFAVTILDLLQRPAVDLFALSNFACNTNFNGEISATITEGTTPGITAGYSYQWFTGLNSTAPADIIAGATTNAITNRQHGDYTVQVIDVASPGLGCQSVATTPINFAETDFVTTVDSTPQTLCAPTQDGSLAVVTITESIEGTTTTYTMSVPGDRTRFDFQWFDEVPSPITAVVNGANTLTNRLAGTYHVQVTNPLGCSSIAESIIVEDETLDPIVTLDDFANPTICLLPETAGFLQVSADNSLNFSDYTFTWFDGPDDTGTQVVADNPTLSNIFHADPDVFTVRVVNKATNCFRLETYTFETDTVAIRVTASSVPLSNCTSNNGTLFAAVQQGNGNLYNYEWYRNAINDGTPDFNTKEVLTAPLGVFSVIARHPVFAFCPTVADTTEVLDGRVFPDPDIEQKNPVTYCDPANPNGVAFATVGGTDLGYSFDWYVGAVSGSPFYSGSEVSGLSAITYSVQATDLASGCAGTQSILIGFEPIPTPAPSVVILSHRTNCLVPDGALTATVNGNVVDYTIQWYNGDDVLATPDNEGEFYRDLDVGPYTTTATDIITKCVSAPVVTEILPFMELPEFDIETSPTFCEQNVGEARYIELNDVVLSSIIWDVAGAQLEGTIITGLPKGVFTVTATSVQQCVNSKEFEIVPEILVYNGISRNGDGKNDFFEISCIEDFPNNTVKIFNRAGTLVYQTKGYNNADVIFEGTSNEGLSLMGRELPDGTYFYIVDKGDGSVPRTGYLELLRQPTN